MQRPSTKFASLSKLLKHTFIRAAMFFGQNKAKEPTKSLKGVQPGTLSNCN